MLVVPRIAWLLVLGRAAHNHTSRDRTRHGVVGIISRDADLDLRDGQRRTWVCANLSSAPRVVVRFLLDRPSNATLEEAATRRDVLFLHAQFSGRGVRFGEKMYLWLMLSRKLFPDAAWVAKVDSDVYICAARMWPFVWHHWTPRVYLGWAHPRGRICAGAARVRLSGSRSGFRLPRCGRAAGVSRPRPRKKSPGNPMPRTPDLRRARFESLGWRRYRRTWQHLGSCKLCPEGTSRLRKCPRRFSTPSRCRARSAAAPRRFRGYAS